MFGLGKKNKIDKVFSLVNQDKHFSRTKAENIFRREDIENLYKLSSDIDTTVTLVLLMHQSVFAQRMEAKAPYDEIAKEFIELAKEKGSDARTLVEREVDGYVESAKHYGNTIAEKLESGRMVSNQDVREFCASHAETMLASWVKYRLNLISALEARIDLQP